MLGKLNSKFIAYHLMHRSARESALLKCEFELTVDVTQIATGKQDGGRHKVRPPIQVQTLLNIKNRRLIQRIIGLGAVD
jgi:hypothetical protein